MLNNLGQPARMDSGSSQPRRSGYRQRELGLQPTAGADWKEEQAAAVCYRIRNGQIELLLVRTRKGRWTFPKGQVEHGWSPARAAGVEAFEEAGVHGRVEETAFARYIRTRDGEAEIKVVVHAHLCEVLELSPPQEAYRSPTWFSARDAKRRLKEQRTPQRAAQLERVLKRALARIEQLQRGEHAPTPS